LAFNCDTERAKTLKWEDVWGVLQYRAAQSIKQKHATDVNSITKEEGEFWLELIKASED